MAVAWLSGAAAQRDELDMVCCACAKAVWVPLAFLSP